MFCQKPIYSKKENETCNIEIVLLKWKQQKKRNNSVLRQLSWHIVYQKITRKPKIKFQIQDYNIKVILALDSRACQHF